MVGSQTNRHAIKYRTKNTTHQDPHVWLGGALGFDGDQQALETPTEPRERDGVVRQGCVNIRVNLRTGRVKAPG
jgi:hypothetical protein